MRSRRPWPTGRPLRRPVGIALSSDEASLYVADAESDAVFVLPAGGGVPVPVPVPGSAGLAPRGLEVKGDLLYLSGVDPGTGQPSVLTLPASGGQPKLLASGLVQPDGIAVGDDGRVFVTDRSAGTVSQVADGKATALAGVSNVTLGSPAGVAVSEDGRSLLVSSLDPTSGTAQVLVVDPASGGKQVFNDVIGSNHGAGGLDKATGSIAP